MESYGKSGSIYTVVRDCFAQEANTGKNQRTKYYKLKEGEKIEFRYPCKCHFRTEDDIYLVLEEDEFEHNTKPFAQIWGNVRSRNQNKLKGILSEKLYDLVTTI